MLTQQTHMKAEKLILEHDHYISFLLLGGSMLFVE
jgi:hypothetical protein